MRSMNPLAQQLNATIERENGHVYAMLSALGKALYFPKEGILSQSAEAKSEGEQIQRNDRHRYSRTDKPMHLKVIQDTLSAYDPKDLYEYAPPAGKPELRTAWREKMLKENPSLAGKSFGNPIVTNALTHGLSIVADLFADAGRRRHHSGQKLGKLRADLRRPPRRARSSNIRCITRTSRFNSRGLREAMLAQKEQRQSDRRPELPEQPDGLYAGRRGRRRDRRGAARRGRSRHQRRRRHRRRLFRPLLRRFDARIAVRPAGRPASARAADQSRRRDEGRVRLGLPRRIHHLRVRRRRRS